MDKILNKKFIPPLIGRYYHFIWPFLGNLIHGAPSKKIKVIGVTGTNGKTTVVHLATEILEEAGFKVASISSLRFKVGDKEWKNELKMTMPGRMVIQKFLSYAVKEGCEYCVLEVTSEGIKQFRHKFINFNTAAFTNLTPEHIESHGGFENYKRAKAELFKKIKNGISIINLDDESADYFLKFPSKEKYAYTVQKSPLELNIPKHYGGVRVIEARDVEASNSGIEFSVDGVKFSLSLLGMFNVHNALAAICIGISHGVSLESMSNTLAKVPAIPGRMEVVIKEPFSVIVDYAHTPDALEKVYKTIKESDGGIKKESRMICVLGSAGGGRDKWKRPKMGEIAAKYCDQIICTNEDPYDESPEGILDDIEEGIKDFTTAMISCFRTLDRREAIKKSMETAKPGDVVVITGKGAEPWMVTKEGKIPWDDREVVREEMKKLG